MVSLLVIGVTSFGMVSYISSKSLNKFEVYSTYMQNNLIIDIREYFQAET